ncbi:MAG: mechanosensitive ion channel [Candidatus Saelkia tenebricola]|nr:mechanosensitive ion channel [Candidatus Saelkia tenebricola]
MLKNLIEQIFWGNSVLEYITCAVVFLLILIAVKILKFVVLRHLKNLAQKTLTTIDDFFVSVFGKAILPLLYFGSFYISLKMLTLAPVLVQSVNVIALALLTVFVARFMTMFANYGFTVYLKKRGKDTTLERSLDSTLKIIKFIIWALAIMFFLDNLGFKISTVIAGLGIGGIAIGLAAQAVLKDLFSYFSIIFDRPFEVGDFIIVGDYLGTVDYIGAKTTRIKSLSGEQVIFSNTDLTDSRVRNYKRMEQRRVAFKFGLIYQTSLTQLKEIPNIVEDIIKNIDDTVFDRAHFFSYGDYSLIFEVVYYVVGSDYNKYMDTQQKINFDLYEEFEKKGIEFAYPTQTLYIDKTNT